VSFFYCLKASTHVPLTCFYKMSLEQVVAEYSVSFESSILLRAHFLHPSMTGLCGMLVLNTDPAIKTAKITTCSKKICSLLQRKHLNTNFRTTSTKLTVKSKLHQRLG
jgi:hypothetical protein